MEWYQSDTGNQKPQSPTQAPSLPWTRLGEIAILTLLAVLCIYLLYIWVLRDLIFVVRSNRVRVAEELEFGPAVTRSALAQSAVVPRSEVVPSQGADPPATESHLPCLHR
nr:movement protein [Digitaria streak virus]